MVKKLFMVLLGCKPTKRNVEQHDYFFGIADSIVDLVPQIKDFWPEAGAGLHIDGWREVTIVNGYSVTIEPKEHKNKQRKAQLFFINLGGYLPGQLAEQHHIVLSVQPDKAQAVQAAKKEVFFKINSIKGARSHIDEKYAIDVDDIYGIEDILSADLKRHYHIRVEKSDSSHEDIITLGYFKLDKLLKNK